jgi:4-carboxymuconolactone decarboxylase
VTNGTPESFEERNARGRAMYAAQFGIGESQVDEALGQVIGPRMAAESIIAAGGYAWSADALAARERSLIVITCLATQGGVEDRLVGHIRWALAQGISFDTLEAAIVLLANYAGQPRASIAMELLRKEAGRDANGVG